MKNTLLALTFAVILISCKKEEPSSDFEPTVVTGTSVIKGYIDKPIKLKDTTSIKSGRAPASGIPVTVTVNKSQLYPNTQVQGADVYHGSTDAGGNYAITVKSNATGVQARLSIDNFVGTIDTVFKNGTVKTGMGTNFIGTVQTPILYMGHNATVNHSF